MKKPNFKGWAEKQMAAAKKDMSRGEIGSAWEKSGRVSKGLASQYEKAGLRHFKTGNSIGAISGPNPTTKAEYRAAREDFEKARKHYAQAGEAYERLNQYSLAAKMYQEAGMRDKAEELSDLAAAERKNRLEGFGLVASILSIVVGISFLSFQMTGNVISNGETSGSNIIGIVVVFIGLVGFLLFSKKS